MHLLIKRAYIFFQFEEPKLLFKEVPQCTWQELWLNLVGLIALVTGISATTIAEYAGTLVGWSWDTFAVSPIWEAVMASDELPRNAR